MTPSESTSASFALDREGTDVLPGLVYIVDDDPSMRRSLSLLAESAGLESIAYASAKEFLDAPREARPACLVLDVRMPRISGLALQKMLKVQGFQIPTIFITGFGDVPAAVRAMRGGAINFIEKPFRDQELLESIWDGIESHREILTEEHKRSALAELFAQVSPRERQVLEMVVKGRPNKYIADQLDLSVKTIEVHRSRLMKKVQATSVAELVRLALRAEATAPL